MVTPTELSIYQLLADDIRAIVAKMERRGAAVVPELARHRAVWDTQLDALRNRARSTAGGAPALVPWHLSAVPVELGARRSR